MSRDIFFLACSASSSRAERSSATFLSSANCQEKKASFSPLLGRIKYNSQSYTPLWSRTLVQLWSNQTTKYLSLQGDRSLRSGDFRKNSWQRRRRSAKPRREREMKWSLPFSRSLDATFPSALQRNHTGKDEIQISFTRQKPRLSGRLSAICQSRGRAGKQAMWKWSRG